MTPDEFTNEELTLAVGNGHKLYVHDWGNKDAKYPIVFLHSGPGNGCADKHKQRFNPVQQRVIFHDQRGSGRSTPYGELKRNTTDDLIADIEKIATKLDVPQFILTGASWGSTLALGYALKHPERVKSLVIQGVFTGSKQEVSYLWDGLHRTHFPDTWQRFVASVPEAHRQNPGAYHFERIFSHDKQAVLEAAKAIGNLEGSLVRLDDRFAPSVIDKNFDPTQLRIEAHYNVNDSFFPEDRYIMNNAHKIKTPTWIVQGRYDFVCPPITAHELSQKMPNSQLIWTEAGHSSSDRGNYDVVQSLLLQASLA